MANQEIDWEAVKQLERELDKNARLSPDSTARDLLLRVAGQVGLDLQTAKQMLSTDEGSGDLVRELRRRIRDGSRRLSRAIQVANRYFREGQPDEGRKVLRDVMEQETVEIYRKMAARELRDLESKGPSSQR
jgi:DUSAM domain-containing protein